MQLYGYMDIGQNSWSAALSFAIAVLCISYHFVRNRNLPPGPLGVPYFGLYPFLSRDTCPLQLEEYGKKYGNLFSFTSFGNLIVNLGSASVIKEAYISKSDCFNTRFETFNILSHLFKEGVVFNHGEKGKVQRKFFLWALREYELLVIRDNAAGPIPGYIETAVQEIESKRGQPVRVMELMLSSKVARNLTTAYFGDVLSDEQIRQIIDAFARASVEFNAQTMLLMGPVGKLVCKTLPSYRQALWHYSRLNDVVMEIVQEIKSTMSDENASSVVEEFYKNKRLRREKNDPTWKYFSDRTLVDSIGQIAGDTIVSVPFFVGTFLAALVEHPEQQEKIYQELMEVVGPNRLPTVQDRSNLHYTNAFINEVLRTNNPLPVFPSVECTKETTLRGYRIPKGSILMLNILQSHHDPSTYDQPYKFDPSRFLPREGESKTELPVTFGIGKRSCIGASLTMLMSFLFITRIVLEFTIEDPSPDIKSRHFMKTGELVLIFQPRKIESMHGTA